MIEPIKMAIAGHGSLHALGGLIVGPLVYFFAREAKGHGVPEVMESIYLKGGVIRPIVAIVKHANPCGVAINHKIENAFVKAHKVDPMSAFGCVIAMNRECNEKIIDYINKENLRELPEILQN